MDKITSEEIKKFISKPSFDEKVILNNDSSYPKISIITPSYNQGEFLERTILSVLNQNYPNLEYIIIDGGSTDNSVEVIKKYEKYISYWVSEKDKGQGDALNKGFSRATGEIIGWQNSDDVYLPEAFRKAVNMFKQSNADIVFGNRLKINEEEKISRRFKFTPFYLISYWYCRMSLSNQSTFWRRELFFDIGMIDASLSFIMDFDFFLRAGIKNKKFVYIESFLGAFRIHKNSKTFTFDRKIIKSQHNLLDKRYGKKEYLKIPFKAYSVLRDSLYYFVKGDFESLFYMAPFYIKPVFFLVLLLFLGYIGYKL
ncbi:MAG: glycosyltransferase family 2 protein [Candidatus Falkowbacteria bacterium]